MAKKKYAYNVMDLKECEKCGKKLKKRLVEQKPTLKLCYKCNQLEKKAAQDEKGREDMRKANQMKVGV